jgi:hypothetical protein
MCFPNSIQYGATPNSAANDLSCSFENLFPEEHNPEELGATRLRGHLLRRRWRRRSRPQWRRDRWWRLDRSQRLDRYASPPDPLKYPKTTRGQHSSQPVGGGTPWLSTRDHLIFLLKTIFVFIKWFVVSIFVIILYFFWKFTSIHNFSLKVYWYT